MDPNFLADPDLGSNNLADPTDPDPRHCSKLSKWNKKNLQIKTKTQASSSAQDLSPRHFGFLYRGPEKIH